METIFIDFSVKKLRQLTSRIDDCCRRLTDEQIWARHGDAQNAVGNLVLHLSGNVRQWIIAGVGGVQFERDRDGEFNATGGVSRDEMLARLSATVEEAIRVLEKQSGGALLRRVHIQKYDLTAIEAVYHVVEHFAMHAGQIMFATKMFVNEDLGYYGHLKQKAHSETTP